MAENSPSLRAQPENKDYFRHNIRGNIIISEATSSNYFISYLPIP